MSLFGSAEDDDSVGVEQHIEQHTKLKMCDGIAKRVTNLASASTDDVD